MPAGLHIYAPREDRFPSFWSCHVNTRQLAKGSATHNPLPPMRKGSLTTVTWDATGPTGITSRQYTIFVNSQATMMRIQSGAPRHGSEIYQPGGCGVRAEKHLDGPLGSRGTVLGSEIAGFLCHRGSSMQIRDVQGEESQHIFSCAGRHRKGHWQVENVDLGATPKSTVPQHPETQYQAENQRRASRDT